MPTLKITRLIFLSVFVWMFAHPSTVLRAQTNLKYQQPPKAIVEIVDVQPTPTIRLSPAAKGQARGMLIEQLSGLPSIADLAQPEFRLAGQRFNPRTNGPSRGHRCTSRERGRATAMSGAYVEPSEWPTTTKGAATASSASRAGRTRSSNPACGSCSGRSGAIAS